MKFYPNMLPTEVKQHPFLTSILFLWLLALPFKNSIYQVSLFFISATAIAHIIKSKDFETMKRLFIRDKLLTLGILILLSSMTISNYYGLDPGHGFETQAKFFYKYILLAFSLQYLFEKRYFSLKVFAGLILFSLKIHIVNGLYQSIVSHDFFYHQLLHGQALTGAFQNRNIFGLFMLVSSCVLSILISTQEYKQWRIYISLLLAASIYCLIFSFSRALWLAYAIFYLIILFSITKQNRLLVNSIPIIIAGFLFLTHEGLFERLNQLVAGFDSGRIDIWLWAITSFKENWFLGYGLETMHLIDNAPDYHFVHNSILEIAISLGVIGLIAYTLIAYRILLTAFRFSFSLFALGVALFTISLFDHSILDGKRFIPILMLYASFVMMSSHKKQTTKQLSK